MAALGVVLTAVGLCVGDTSKYIAVGFIVYSAQFLSQSAPLMGCIKTVMTGVASPAVGDSLASVDVDAIASYNMLLVGYLLANDLDECVS